MGNMVHRVKGIDSEGEGGEGIDFNPTKYSGIYHIIRKTMYQRNFRFPYSVSN